MREVRERPTHTEATHVGRRDNNEDGILVRADRGLYAVADGMGGYEGGEVASRIALEHLAGFFERLGPDGMVDAPEDEGIVEGQLQLALRMSDSAVRRAATGPLSKMGTTIVVLALKGRRALVAHVGDSRLYRFRDGQLELLTRDHTLAAELESAGFDTMAGGVVGLSHVVTQALGQGSSIRPDFQHLVVAPGDRFLLCSDGLSDVFYADELQRMLADPAIDAEALVSLAYVEGGSDNISAVLVDVAGK